MTTAFTSLINVGVTLALPLAKLLTESQMFVVGVAPDPVKAALISEAPV